MLGKEDLEPYREDVILCLLKSRFSLPIRLVTRLSAY